mmetsp:Transcript_7223/g.18387  ORF Transcript_7223/g.18387 Transcript_7223/m.18387 type:complete len:228 (-) Transcript_7223:541-1224(-)
MVHEVMVATAAEKAQVTPGMGLDGVQLVDEEERRHGHQVCACTAGAHHQTAPQQRAHEVRRRVLQEAVHGVHVPRVPRVVRLDGVVQFVDAHPGGGQVHQAVAAVGGEVKRRPEEHDCHRTQRPETKRRLHVEEDPLAGRAGVRPKHRQQRHRHWQRGQGRGRGRRRQQGCGTDAVGEREVHHGEVQRGVGGQHGHHLEGAGYAVGAREAGGVVPPVHRAGPRHAVR